MNVHAPPQTPLLDLDLLRTLVAIADTGNFSEAAKVVFRTPSAVSMQVKRNEDLVGRPVFVREARTVSLNTDGETLVMHARRMLALNRDTLARFVSPNVTGVVRLGALDHAVDRFIPAALCCFAQTHPGIRVDVVVENSRATTDMFMREELDLIIRTNSASGKGAEFAQPIFREKLVWAGLKGGVAAEQTPLPVSVWEEGCIWRKHALEALEAQGRDYRINFMSAHVAGQKAGILADLTIAPLPLSACTGQIVPLGPEFGLPELPDYEMSILVRKDAPPPVQSLADHLLATIT